MYGSLAELCHAMLRSAKEWRVRSGGLQGGLERVGRRAIRRFQTQGEIEDDDFRELLSQCAPEHRGLFDSERNRLQRHKGAMATLATATVDQLSVWNVVRDSTAEYPLAAQLLISPSADKAWPPRQYDLLNVLEVAIDHKRRDEGELPALRNAMMLLRGMLAGRKRSIFTDDHWVLLTITWTALDLAAVLGHSRALLFVHSVLEQLRNDFPYDEQTNRLYLGSQAIVLSHFDRRSKTLLSKAIALHAQQINLVEGSIGSETFAKEWSRLHRSGLGSYYNILNLMIEAEMSLNESNDFYHMHLDACAAVEAFAGREAIPSGHPKLDPRIRHAVLDANMRLNRPDRGRSLSGCEPDRALEGLMDAFTLNKEHPYIGALEWGALNVLYGEALLCIYARKRNGALADQYCEVREEARLAFARAGSTQKWSRRLDRLEDVVGIDRTLHA